MDEASSSGPSRWRLKAYRGEELREFEEDGSVDEIVVDHWLHIEKMDDGLWWMRLGDARIMVSVAAGGQAVVDVCRAVFAPQSGTSSVHRDPSATP